MIDLALNNNNPGIDLLIELIIIRVMTNMMNLIKYSELSSV